MDDVSNHDQAPAATRRVCPMNGWPREIVVEHKDGTVSLLANVTLVDGSIRSRRAGDVFRELIS